MTIDIPYRDWLVGQALVGAALTHKPPKFIAERAMAIADSTITLLIQDKLHVRKVSEKDVEAKPSDV